MTSARRSIEAHPRLGASTGYLREHVSGWPALVDAAREVSESAVELSALAEDELPGLLAFLQQEPELPFGYVSVHAPSKRLTLPEAERVALLASLPDVVDAIVVHPDTIGDVDLYRELGPRLLLENLDDRKAGGRTAAELVPVFSALPDAGLCFDVAHAWSVDLTMAVGHEILDAFASAVGQVHLSSVDAGRHHVPLRDDNAERFLPLLDRCRHVPWILEAPPA